LSKVKIAIVDYGAGNIKSIENAFFRLGIQGISLAKSEADLVNLDALVLPGVGAFANCANNLKKSGLLPTVEDLVLSKSLPILGICVGMQLFFDSSDEDGHFAGLGWVPGAVEIIEPPKDFKIPHVGWNQISIKDKASIFDKTQDGTNFYFDHSYSVKCASPYVSSTTFHGIDLISSIESGNIHGVQFHPEKSGKSGLRVLRAFVDRI
jgi:imidazole glycerol-phosphate synthase subunit HisH